MKVFLYAAFSVCTKCAPLRTFYTPFLLSIYSCVFLLYLRSSGIFSSNIFNPPPALRIHVCAFLAKLVIEKEVE
jgi:hypothetical protein